MIRFNLDQTESIVKEQNLSTFFPFPLFSPSLFFYPRLLFSWLSEFSNLKLYLQQHNIEGVKQ